MPERSPFVEFDRDQWSALADSAPLPLTAADVVRLRGLGDPIDLAEVDAIFRPLASLLQIYVAATRGLHLATGAFLRDIGARTPYVIGVAGSVAVGKSSMSRLLREMMSRFPESASVALVTTDGFLYPNAELQRRGLMERKGFPESFDRRAMLRFVHAVKSGAAEVTAPVYSHLTYDIAPDERVVVRSPDILIVEGLNVLQPARVGAQTPLAISDFFDFSIYVDADPDDIKRWYVRRFLALKGTAFQDERSYFRRYGSLSTEEAVETASAIWDTINAPNLLRNIAPTRGRATLVLRKGPDHCMRRMRLRKL
ncbi:MAG: type I pantothenate kinase [Actinomycetota bacterium]